MQVVKMHPPPKIGMTECSRDNLGSGTIGNHRKGLSKVSTKQGGDASKDSILTSQIMQGMVYTLHHITMLRAHFIPNDQRCLHKQLMIEVIFFDGASAGLMNGNGD